LYEVSVRAMVRVKSRLGFRFIFYIYHCIFLSGLITAFSSCIDVTGDGLHINNNSFLLGSVYFTGDILVARDRLKLLCRQSKIWSRGMTQYHEKGHFVRKTPSCSWCNGITITIGNVLRLLCLWFSIRLSPSLADFRFVFFSLLFFRLRIGTTFKG